MFHKVQNISLSWNAIDSLYSKFPLIYWNVSDKK